MYLSIVLYQDLSTRHDWPVKKAFFVLPIQMKGKLKHSFGTSLSLLGSQNKDIGVASQTLLTDVKLGLRRRLLGPLASLYALGHYFQVGLAGRAHALFYIYDQTDALYDPLSGRKTLTLP